MRIVLTRPAEDAKPWLDALQGAGHEVCLLPLIQIGPSQNQKAIDEAWHHWGDCQAVMFVSAQAVRYFFKQQPVSLVVDSKNSPRCWATGPGTHKALLQAGVPEALIDSPSADAHQFDSEALWQRVTQQMSQHAAIGQQVLIVRGQDMGISSGTGMSIGTGRNWLAQQLEASGARAQFVVAYERREPVWTNAQIDQARSAASDGAVWLFSSSQAIAHLQRALPDQSWAQARCVATHPRIAQTAQVLGFGEIHTTRPQLTELLASLESLA
jgi:uroporphyrinogen-III synthase